jgi:hypothetical protein
MAAELQGLPRASFMAACSVGALAGVLVGAVPNCAVTLLHTRGRKAKPA